MVDTEKIKEAIKIAKEAASGENDELIKKEVFNITYSKLLDKLLLESQNTTSSSDTLPNHENNLNQTQSFEDKISNFANRCRLTIKELKEVFYFENELIYLITQFNGSEAEKQTRVSQCILTAYELLFEKEWINASLLMKCIDLSGIGNLDHFARNMRRKNIFRIRGKGKGKILEYKISGSGRIEAFELIHDLVKGDIK